MHLSDFPYEVPDPHSVPDDGQPGKHSIAQFLQSTADDAGLPNYGQDMGPFGETIPVGPGY